MTVQKLGNLKIYYFSNKQEGWQLKLPVTSALIYLNIDNRVAITDSCHANVQTDMRSADLYVLSISRIEFCFFSSPKGTVMLVNRTSFAIVSDER